MLLPSCHEGNVFTYSVHRYHYYHHTMIRSDTAEISIYTMRRVALCVLTNNSEDNEYIQVFMVLFIHVLQNLQVPVSKSSSCHPCQIVKYRAAHFHVEGLSGNIRPKFDPGNHIFKVGKLYLLVTKQRLTLRTQSFNKG